MNSFSRLYCGRLIPLLVLFLTYLSSPVLAAIPPNSGAILQEQAKPQTSPKLAPTIEVGPEQGTAPSENGIKIQVKHIKITGQNVVPEGELLPLLSSSLGKEITFGELEILAGNITKYFHDKGYLVATAFLPQQEIKDGVVEIQVTVGQYGKIDIHNHSTLKEEIVIALISSLQKGDYIKRDSLEPTLLRLNDTYGISVKATLTPSSENGKSDLILEINDTPRTNGQITVDNWGNRFTGSNRIGLNLNINNPSGRGDLLNLGATYAGEGMDNYNFSYTLPVDGKGTKVGGGYSCLNYTLGQDFASLHATGVAKTTSLFASFELARSRKANLTGKIEYATKQLTDRIDAIPSISDKQANIWTASLSGYSIDQIAGGGMNSFTLSYLIGNLKLKSADAITNDNNAHSAGSYSKMNLAVNRLQVINNRLNLYLAFTGQLANKNLDSSEKLQLGGPTGVRAYPVGESPGDQGYLFTSELCWNMPTPSFQLAAFYDMGKVTINKNPWTGSGINNRFLSGAGLGLRWNKPNDFSIRLDYAWKITSDLATADTDKNGRLWLQGVKNF